MSFKMQDFNKVYQIQTQKYCQKPQCTQKRKKKSNFERNENSLILKEMKNSEKSLVSKKWTKSDFDKKYVKFGKIDLEKV